MVKILIAGDYAPSERVAELVNVNKFEQIFGEVSKYTSEVDYSIVNLESPVVNSNAAMPIDKCGPSLKCNTSAIHAIKYAGFDMVTLANNHFYDYGEDGVKDSIQSCIDNEIEFVGGGFNVDQAGKTFYKNIKGVRFAFINCCENEFSIAQSNKGGSNPINPIKQFYDIKDASHNADVVVVIAHGGPEGYEYPTPRMKELFHFFIDCGADVVVNHHQHCYSGYEYYHDKLIVYGLGNFSFDESSMNDPKWNKGYMGILKFFEGRIELDCIPYSQGIMESPGIKILEGPALTAFHQNIDYINSVINNDTLLLRHYNDFLEQKAASYLIALEPYTNKYLRAARYKNLIPSTLSKDRAFQILDFIICESHLERMRYALEQACKHKL